MRLAVAALFAAALSALSLAALAGGVIHGELTEALEKKPVAGAALRADRSPRVNIPLLPRNLDK